MKIISISDVITNSSSEVFCYITHDSDEVLEEIYDLLNNLFGWDQELEETPVVTLENDRISIEMPYHLSTCSAFYKAGLEAILADNFEHYSIDFI